MHSDIVNLSSTIAALLDRPRFLKWLNATAPAGNARDYQIDRLIPRNNAFDLRIRIQNECGESSAMAFQIVPATAVIDDSLSLGSWELVYCDPASDSQLQLVESLDRALHGRLGQLLGSEVVESSLFSYTPFRRAIIRYCCRDGADYFGKLYRPGRSEQAIEMANDLRKSGLNEYLVEPIVRIAELEMVIWRRAGGSLLAQAFPRVAYRDGLRLAAAALRQVHDAEVPNIGHGKATGQRTLSDELRVAGTYLNRVSTLLGTQPSELAACFAKLEHCVMDFDKFEAKNLHGDFHDNQILLAESKAVLLDLDQCGRGDPAIDVGNLLAHIDFRIAFEEADDDPKPYAAAFLDGYGEVGDGSFQRRVVFGHAVSLLRNCCLYVLVPERCRLLTGACRRTLEGLRGLW